MEGSILELVQLNGTLSAMETLHGELSIRAGLSGAITVPSVVGADTYDGDYEVTPRLTVQTLETLNKMMLDDVTVHEIPITSTSNPQGGQTVLIG